MLGCKYRRIVLVVFGAHLGLGFSLSVLHDQFVRCCELYNMVFQYLEYQLFNHKCSLSPLVPLSAKTPPIKPKQPCTYKPRNFPQKINRVILYPPIISIPAAIIATLGDRALR